VLARIATHSRQPPEGWVPIESLSYVIRIICYFLSACLSYYHSSLSQLPTHSQIVVDIKHGCIQNAKQQNLA
jgi:hypothetical protein